MRHEATAAVAGVRKALVDLARTLGDGATPEQRIAVERLLRAADEDVGRAVLARVSRRDDQ